MRSSVMLNVHSLRCLLAATLLTAATGADWPRFRGPDGSAVSSEMGLPVTWSDDENVAWRAELPGPGSSSPIVVGGRVFLTCYSGYGLDEAAPGDQAELLRHVLCIDRADGSVVWQRDVAPDLPEQEFQGFLALHGYASSTPASDGERVYVFFGKSGVLAYDLDGTLLWHQNVGSGTHNWGSAASPVLYGDLVIVNAGVEEGKLIALDKQSGNRVWEAGPVQRSWGTPVLVRTAAGDDELVLSMEGRVVGYNPADGSELWHCEGIDDYVCPSVVAKADIVYIIGGRKGQAIAIRTGGRGTVDDTHVVWRERGGSNVTSPVAFGEHLLWVSDSGIAYCLRLDTGETVKRSRLGGSGRIYASVVAADGKLYAVSRESGTYVLSADADLEVLAQNEFASDRSIFNASPAVHDGQLLLRSNRYLYCLGERD